MDVDEFIKTTKGHDPSKCIGCAKCLSPQHRIIKYKYPSQMDTLYKSQFASELNNYSSVNTPFFNYDKLRNVLKI
jgi:hypothetical protein